MSTYTAEVATFYDSPETALNLLMGRICAVECPEAKKQVGVAHDFKLAVKKMDGLDVLDTLVLACTVDIDEAALQELSELHQEGCQLYVGQHLLVGPLN